jgi:hypothetical protein
LGGLEEERARGALGELSRDESTGMTVNERLYAAGLLQAFDSATARRDETELRRILASVFLTESDISAIVRRQLSRSGE